MALLFGEGRSGSGRGFRLICKECLPLCLPSKPQHNTFLAPAQNQRGSQVSDGGLIVGRKSESQ